jgi:hypothetical protein
MSRSATGQRLTDRVDWVAPGTSVTKENRQ